MEKESISMKQVEIPLRPPHIWAGIIIYTLMCLMAGSSITWFAALYGKTPGVQKYWDEKQNDKYSKQIKGK